jgi:hypothetical protein
MAANLNSHPGNYLVEGRPSKILAAQPSLAPSSEEVQDTMDIFRFFDLPRELRDKVHEQPVLVEHWHMRPFTDLPDAGDHYFCTKAEKLRTSLLLVNRQFRDEYVEQCMTQQVLCLSDLPDWIGDSSVLAALNWAKFWILAICKSDSSIQLEAPRKLGAPRKLDTYLGKCAQWYHDLRAVNIGLSLNYQRTAILTTLIS